MRSLLQAQIKRYRCRVVAATFCAQVSSPAGSFLRNDIDNNNYRHVTAK